MKEAGFCCRNRNVQSGCNMLDHAVVYPPNGVVPFHGFALFCAPFCYVYSGKSIEMAKKMVLGCVRSPLGRNHAT